MVKIGIFFQVGSFVNQISIELALQIKIVLSRDCPSFLKIVSKDDARISQKMVIMIFPADETHLAFFGAISPGEVHCFDCSFMSGVL